MEPFLIDQFKCMRCVVWTAPYGFGTHLTEPFFTFISPGTPNRPFLGFHSRAIHIFSIKNGKRQKCKFIVIGGHVVSKPFLCIIMHLCYVFDLERKKVHADCIVLFRRNDRFNNLIRLPGAASW